MATVPAGIYDLVVDASATRWKTNPSAMIWGSAPRTGPEPIEVEIVASTGMTFLSNVIFAGFLILIPLGFMFFRHSAFAPSRTGEHTLSGTAAQEDAEHE